jgi:hypothetical protein
MFSFNFSSDKIFWLLMLILVLPGLVGIWPVPPEALILPVFVRAALVFIFLSIFSFRQVSAYYILTNLLGVISLILIALLFGKLFLMAGEYYSTALGLQFTESSIDTSILMSLLALASLLYAYFIEEKAMGERMERHQSELSEGFALLMLFALSTDIYRSAPLGAQLPILTISIIAVGYALSRGLKGQILSPWEIDESLKMHVHLKEAALMLLLSISMVSIAVLAPGLTIPFAVAFICAGHLLRSY